MLNTPGCECVALAALRVRVRTTHAVPAVARADLEDGPLRVLAAQAGRVYQAVVQRQYVRLLFACSDLGWVRDTRAHHVLRQECFDRRSETKTIQFKQNPATRMVSHTLNLKAQPVTYPGDEFLDNRTHQKEWLLNRGL